VAGREVRFGSERGEPPIPKRYGPLRRCGT